MWRVSDGATRCRRRPQNSRGRRSGEDRVALQRRSDCRHRLQCARTAGRRPLETLCTGEVLQTNDIMPKAGAADLDDSGWQMLDPTTLEARRANGKVCFSWYRINVTIPDKIANFDPTGSTVYFEIVIDDYAEIYVDGRLSKTFGQSGGSVVKGFNARNRVLLGEDVKPGQSIQLAVFGINGPISQSPTNYIWIRSATLDFYEKRPKFKAWQGLGEIVRIDSAL